MAGLFDYQSPENMRAARLQPLLVSGAQMGQQPLLSQLVSQMSNAGANIGATGAGMLGLQLPEEARQQQVQSIMQGVDLTSAEELTGAAKQFADMGETKYAQELMSQANSIDDRAMARQKFNFDMQPKAPETTKLAKLMTEQAKYEVGTPGFKAYQGAIDKETAATEGSKSSLEKLMDVAGVTDPKQRQAMGKKALDLQLDANKGDPTAAAALSLMTKQLELQILQQRVDKGNSSVAASEAAGVKKNKADAYKASSILETITTSISQVGSNTAGLGGSIMGVLAGSEAVDLEANLDTIAANLGFDQLQAMRDASPTGGALGQVSERELIALQSTVASLKQKQSPDQLKKNLEKIKGHYKNWLSTLDGINPDDKKIPGQGGGKSTPIYASNGSQRIVSTDGGQTWKEVR